MRSNKKITAEEELIFQTSITLKATSGVGVEKIDERMVMSLSALVSIDNLQGWKGK